MFCFCRRHTSMQLGESMNMAILLFVATGVLYGRPAAGLSILQCETGVLELDMESASHEIKCEGASGAEVIEWSYYGSQSSRITCDPSGNCSSDTSSSLFAASRSAGSSYSLLIPKLDVKKHRKDYVVRVTCRSRKAAFGQAVTLSASVNCLLDVVNAAEVTSCSVKFNTAVGTDWTVSGGCDVSKAFSQRGRYSFRWTEEHSVTGNKTVVDNVLTTTGSSPESDIGYKAMKSVFNKLLPQQTGDYRYSVVVSPGSVKPDVVFFGSARIERPTNPPSHDCPQYIEVGKNVLCTCSTTDLGQPPGGVMWKGSSTNELSFLNVGEAQHGSEYECYVIWNGLHLLSVNYTLQVPLPPSTPEILLPPGTPYPFIAGETPSTTLTCRSSFHGRPNTSLSYTWILTHGGREGVDEDGRGTLTFDTFSKEHDGKTVSCAASNGFTQFQPVGSLTLEVYYRPAISLDSSTDAKQCQSISPVCIVPQKKPVHIRCSVSSNPEPAVVKWLDDDDVDIGVRHRKTGLTGVDLDLYIESASTEHTGNYTCSVVTGLGHHGNDSRLPFNASGSFALQVRTQSDLFPHYVGMLCFVIVQIIICCYGLGHVENDTANEQRAHDNQARFVQDPTSDPSGVDTNAYRLNGYLYSDIDLDSISWMDPPSTETNASRVSDGQSRDANPHPTSLPGYAYPPTHLSTTSTVNRGSSVRLLMERRDREA